MQTVTHDLGLGWFANMHDDGTMTIRNPDKGQRIELNQESVKTLGDIFAKVASKERK